MIAKNLAQTFQLIAALSQTENLGEAIGKAYDEFRQLPLEKQAEHITTIIATFLIPVPGKISSVIDSTNKTLRNFGKICTREAAGIQSLCKVEGATLKPGQILSGVRASQAPFLAGCQSAIKTVAKGMKAPKIIGKVEGNFNFSVKAIERMINPHRAIPVQVLKDIIKNPLHVLKDPKGSQAFMYYAQMSKNGKLYNAEVLYNESMNSIWHFVYTESALGPLPKIK